MQQVRPFPIKSEMNDCAWIKTAIVECWAGQ